MNETSGGATLSALADRYYAEGDGTRKASSYLRSYEQRLEARRQMPLRVLELGVSSGASLLLWRDYLPRATIIGIDVAEQPECLIDQSRVRFIQGSQDDPAVLDLAAQLAGGGFDLIIDDASHIGFLTKRSFNYLFPRWLVPGGCYVIEDFGTGYLPEYPDGAAYTTPPWNDAVPGTAVFHSHQHGMVGFVKQLIDHTMQELMTNTRSYLPIERITFEPNVVFVDRARYAGTLVPGPLPSDLTMPTDQTRDHIGDETRQKLIEIENRLRATASDILGLNNRLVALEQLLGRLFQRVEPVRRIWRVVTGKRPVSQRK